MTATNISLTILAGLVAIIGLGYLLLASELAGIREELAAREAEAEQPASPRTEVQELGEKCRLTTLTLYPKRADEK